MYGRAGDRPRGGRAAVGQMVHTLSRMLIFTDLLR